MIFDLRFRFKKMYKIIFAILYKISCLLKLVSFHKIFQCLNFLQT